MKNMPLLHIGDKITFRVTTREKTETVTRKIVGFYVGRPTVRYFGHKDFVVNYAEILDVIQPWSHGKISAAAMSL